MCPIKLQNFRAKTSGEITVGRQVSRIVAWKKAPNNTVLCAEKITFQVALVT